MAMYPEAQKKAQAELDMVVGKSRLPTFDDRPFLPYVDALVKESFRWWNVAPISTFLNYPIFKQLRDTIIFV